MSRRSSLRLPLLLGAFVALATTARAQEDAAAGRFGVVEDRQSNAQSYFFHVLPGEMAKQVYVWGPVRSPGVYVVGTRLDLSEVLSLAGGPLLGTTVDNDQREVTVRLYRSEGGRRSLVYEAPLVRAVEDAASVPVPGDGDIIQVEMHDVRGRTWRDTLAVVSTVGSLTIGIATLILQIAILAR